MARKPVQHLSMSDVWMSPAEEALAIEEDGVACNPQSYEAVLKVCKDLAYPDGYMVLWGGDNNQVHTQYTFTLRYALACGEEAIKGYDWCEVWRYTSTYGETMVCHAVYQRLDKVVFNAKQYAAPIGPEVQGSMSKYVERYIGMSEAYTVAQKLTQVTRRAHVVWFIPAQGLLEVVDESGLQEERDYQDWLGTCVCGSRAV